MLVGVNDDGIALLLGNADGRNFTRQVARLLSGHSFHLAGQGHAVLCFALNFVIGGHVLCRLWHRVHTILFFHQFVNEAPANGGVVHGIGAAKSRFGFGHHKRCAAHAFYTARNHQAGFARLDGT